MTIDEFFEDPRVEGNYSRNIIFPRLRWIRKSKFEEELNKCNDLQIYPCLNEDQPIKNRVYLGKLIPSSKLYGSNNENELISELVGSVFYSDENIWKLRTTYLGQTYEEVDDFLILNLEDPNSYFWNGNDAFQKVQLPNYALRVAFDLSDSYYQFAGRRSKQNLNSKYSIIFYSNAWLKVENKLELTFGKIKSDSRLLMIPYENMEIGHSEYEVLCLKASPASLRIICRTAIRKFLNYSQKKIKSLCKPNEKCALLPNFLVNFLKYPPFLNIGDCMLREEKLVHENDEYELSFDHEKSDLICKKLTECDQRISREWILQRNTDCILLHPFNAVFFNNLKKKAVKSDSINTKNVLLPYIFFLNWENLTFEIKYLNS